MSPHTQTEAQKPDWLSLDLPEVSERIQQLGLVRDAFAAIQIDLNPVSKLVGDVLHDVTLCDHNCTTEYNGKPTGGSYTCPAAMSLNKGLNPKDLAPTEQLLSGLQTTLSGIRLARKNFLQDKMADYFKEFEIPESIAQIYGDLIDTDTVEVNLFGGSPEMHPGILEIISELQKSGNRVHLTTTGRRMMQDQAFFEAFLQQPSDLLAFGADDFETAAFVDELMGKSLEELRKEWTDVPWYHGQRKKAYEAIYMTKVAAEHEHFPPILYNMVVHPSNLTEIIEILDAIHRHAPDVILNPYPAQTAFLYEHSAFTAEELRKLEAFTDLMIEEHLSVLNGGKPRWNLAPRIHYWLMMKAAFQCKHELDAQGVADLIGGEGIWTCYAKPGAGRCVQIASSHAAYDAEKAFAGGHLGCFWNSETVTDNRQVWNMGVSDVAEWVFGTRLDLAEQNGHPCKGCAFPRMSFDSISLELGLGDRVRTKYLELRRTHLNF